MSPGSRLVRTYTFTVAGSGPFPFEALRHDKAAPRTSKDSATLSRSHQKAVRTVALIASQRPNAGVWGAYGWALESVE